METSLTTIFSSDHSVIFSTKKGDVKSISPEGALFKGGAALVSLKDAAMDSAIVKAANGRYTASVDIIEAAFPAASKATFLTVGMPSLNKFNFKVLLTAVDRSPEPVKGFSKKQLAARDFARALRNIPALAVESDTRTLEMATVDA